eukprot:gene13454-19312_t
MASSIASMIRHLNSAYRDKMTELGVLIRDTKSRLKEGLLNSEDPTSLRPTKGTRQLQREGKQRSLGHKSSKCDHDLHADDEPCEVCGSSESPETTLLCDACNGAWHLQCLQEPLAGIPKGDWICPSCCAVGINLARKRQCTDPDQMSKALQAMCHKVKETDPKERRLAIQKRVETLRQTQKTSELRRRAHQRPAHGASLSLREEDYKFLTSASQSTASNMAPEAPSYKVADASNPGMQQPNPTRILKKTGILQQQANLEGDVQTEQTSANFMLASPPSPQLHSEADSPNQRLIDEQNPPSVEPQFTFQAPHQYADRRHTSQAGPSCIATRSNEPLTSQDKSVAGTSGRHEREETVPEGSKSLQQEAVRQECDTVSAQIRLTEDTCEKNAKALSLPGEAGVSMSTSHTGSQEIIAESTLPLPPKLAERASAPFSKLVSPIMQLEPAKQFEQHCTQAAATSHADANVRAETAVNTQIVVESGASDGGTTVRPPMARGEYVFGRLGPSPKSKSFEFGHVSDPGSIATTPDEQTGQKVGVAKRQRIEHSISSYKGRQGTPRVTPDSRISQDDVASHRFSGEGRHRSEIAPQLGRHNLGGTASPSEVLDHNPLVRFLSPKAMSPHPTKGDTGAVLAPHAKPDHLQVASLKPKYAGLGKKLASSIRSFLAPNNLPTKLSLPLEVTHDRSSHTLMGRDGSSSFPAASTDGPSHSLVAKGGPSLRVASMDGPPQTLAGKDKSPQPLGGSDEPSLLMQSPQPLGGADEPSLLMPPVLMTCIGRPCLPVASTDGNGQTATGRDESLMPLAGKGETTPLMSRRQMPHVPVPSRVGFPKDATNTHGSSLPLMGKGDHSLPVAHQSIPHLPTPGMKGSAKAAAHKHGASLPLVGKDDHTLPVAQQAVPHLPTPSMKGSAKAATYKHGASLPLVRKPEPALAVAGTDGSQLPGPIPALPVPHNKNVLPGPIPVLPVPPNKNVLPGPVPALPVPHNKNVLPGPVPALPVPHNKNVLSGPIPVLPVPPKKNVLPGPVPALPVPPNIHVVPGPVPAMPVPRKKNVLPGPVPTLPVPSNKNARPGPVPALPGPPKKNVQPGSGPVPALPVLPNMSVLQGPVPALPVPPNRDVLPGPVTAVPVLTNMNVRQRAAAFQRLIAGKEALQDKAFEPLRKTWRPACAGDNKGHYLAEQGSQGMRTGSIIGKHLAGGGSLGVVPDVDIGNHLAGGGALGAATDESMGKSMAEQGLACTSELVAQAGHPQGLAHLVLDAQEASEHDSGNDDNRMAEYAALFSSPSVSKTRQTPNRGRPLSCTQNVLARELSYKMSPFSFESDPEDNSGADNSQTLKAKKIPAWAEEDMAPKAAPTLVASGGALQMSLALQDWRKRGSSTSWVAEHAVTYQEEMAYKSSMGYL